MPVIRINDGVFMDLKAISKWLETGTPSETINALVREKMQALGLERDAIEEASLATETPDGMMFQNAPNLTYTRILSAIVNGEPLQNANWAGLLVEICKIVKGRGLSQEDLCRELQAPAKPFKVTEQGYKFHPTLGISIQGQSAPDAWRETQRLAQKYKIPVEIKFQWREKEGAQYPGKVGILNAG